MPTVTLKNPELAFKAIVPVVKVSLAGEPTLIGTAFFITNTGVLVTARHVIQDNIGADGIDLGGIGVFHTWGPLAGIYRPLRRSQWHSQADLAVCEAAQPTSEAGEAHVDYALSLSVVPAQPGERLSSHFFHDASLVPDRSISNERVNPRKTWAFSANVVARSAGASTPPTDGQPRTLAISSRITQGMLCDCYPNGRDSVMLPFPVYSSSLPIYAGASGGPVFNTSGEVIAVNCTRIEGSDISFHAALTPLLDFVLADTYTPDDPTSRTRTFRELAKLRFMSIRGA